MPYGLSLLSVATERAIALAVLLQTLELWQIRSACADTGVWRASVLREEYAGFAAPLRWLCELVLPYEIYVGLLVSRLACAACLLLSGLSVVLPVLCLSQWLICLRFRGSFNGGSDAMSMVILSAMSVSTCAGQTTLVSRFALLYIAVQVTLSYVIAGLSKLTHAEWRNGQALVHFITRSPYAAPAWLVRAKWLENRAFCCVLAWGLMGFECLFPCAWLDPRACLGFIALGVCFHLANTAVFGLNRFVFAWAAGYPALVYGSQWIDALRAHPG
jgi:hypothetical protein